ncbi:MAG: NADH-quinone oxidoreductase subunit G [Campylobacterales bacterium]
MSKVTIHIDGRPIECNEGEYVLDVARGEGIFIPAICYLNRCSPSLACRICMVESDGKSVYACNAKAKDGMNITVSTPEIEEERRNIMEVYDINHPLQCGVCDQSGECELQNYTLEMGVETQNFSIQDTARPTKEWSDFITYDSSLCIVCERCTTVCKDMVGDMALKTIPRGGEQLDKGLKETLSKDLFAMWNKMQKSIIGPVSGERLECSDCGECISVCPVGAISSSGFSYSSNAWELEKTPSACAHCSIACLLNYETKHTSVSNSRPKIYRVTNDFAFQSLCGAGRFGYDFENRASKDSSAFSNALEAFKKADTIAFDSYITNEEALILQKLKEKLGVKLVNKDALAYQNFLKEFSLKSKKSLYSASLEDVYNADFTVVVGSNLKSDAPILKYALNNSLKINKAASAYFHTLKDAQIESTSKNLSSFTYLPNQEEKLLYLLADSFIEEDRKPTELKEQTDKFKSKKIKQTEEKIKEKIKEVVEVDGESKEVEKVVEKTITKEVEYIHNSLLDTLNISHTDFATLLSTLSKKENKTLIIGSDLYTHKRSKNIAKLVGLIEANSDFKVILIPTSTNTLGVSLICDLDKEEGSYTVGYNVEGDFKLSSLGDGELDMPALNQQEGTFTNIDKRVVKLNPALPYSGYELNDIAKALGLTNKHTIDYTKELPEAKGYKSIEFDQLPNSFLNNGKEDRGYLLQNIDCPSEENSSIEPIEELEEYNGTIIYLSNPILQFNRYTAKASELSSELYLSISKTLAEELGVESKDVLTLSSEGGSISLECVVDSSLVNSAVLVPDFIQSKDIDTLFKQSRYIKADIRKV